ncbi:MAG: deoxyribose-phosphate aldolase [Clostridia bacterium]|nr:deoxyribose-phosphate aldolase [Clostridia bacterium]
MELNKYIDHTILKAFATEDDVRKICNEAIEYDFASVCINPCHVKLAAQLLGLSDVKVCTVIGFPLGANSSDVKAYEAKKAIEEGADEVDMVINVGKAKQGDWDFVRDDIRKVREAAKDKLLKVIVETCYLTDEEIFKACIMAKEAEADFVKTSTGFGTGGATVEHVKLMRDAVGETMGVKASGGVRTKEDALKMIEAGATRIGTSNGKDIIG